MDAGLGGGTSSCGDRGLLCIYIGGAIVWDRMKIRIRMDRKKKFRWISVGAFILCLAVCLNTVS